MDWKNLFISIAAVFAVMYISGFCISMLGSFIQCGKTSITESGTEGAIWASFPTFIYGLAATIGYVRHPFSDTLAGFGVDKINSELAAVGYLMMLSTWVSTVWVVHNTERAVCVPSTSEMTEFKERLLKQLAEKQAANEKKE